MKTSIAAATALLALTCALVPTAAAEGACYYTSFSYNNVYGPGFSVSNAECTDPAVCNDLNATDGGATVGLAGCNAAYCGDGATAPGSDLQTTVTGCTDPLDVCFEEATGNPTFVVTSGGCNGVQHCNVLVKRVFHETC